MSDIVGFNEPLIEVPCNTCKYYFRDKPGFTCEAFSDRIPTIILMGDHDHKTPLKDQKNNIVFEPED